MITSEQRVRQLLSRAEKLGLINHATGMGAPTEAMLVETVTEATNDAFPETDELAMYVRRLVRIIRKTDPENKVAASAVEFLKCTGHAKIFTR